MAITYHSGRRIQKLDNDTIPTASTCDTFTSDNWAEVGGLFGVSGGKFAFEINTTARDDHASLDTGSLLSASTTWTLRFNKIRFTTITNNDPNLIIGLSDGTEGGGTAQKWIGARILPQGGSANGLFRPYSVNESAPNGGQDENNTLQYYANKDYYVEIKKTASNAYRARLSTTPEHSGDLVDSPQGGVTSGITGRYIKVMNGEGEIGGTLIGTIDSIEFWTPAPSDSDHKTENQMPLSNQIGSRLEQTNTRKMYNYADPLTFESNFSSASGWTESDSNDIGVANGKLNWYNNGTNTYENAYYDLGSVSDTKWILRHTLKVSGTPSSDEIPYQFLISNTANANWNTDSACLGWWVYVDRNNAWRRIYTSNKASGTSGGDNGAQASPRYWSDFAYGTTYYITTTRTSATNMTVEIRTGSHSGSIVSNGTLTLTIPSGITGLRYLTANQAGQGTGLSMEVDDVEFYNGVTSTSNYWQEIGA